MYNSLLYINVFILFVVNAIFSLHLLIFILCVLNFFNTVKSIQKPFNEHNKCGKSVILLHFVINLFPFGQYGNVSSYFILWLERIYSLGKGL